MRAVSCCVVSAGLKSSRRDVGGLENFRFCPICGCKLHVDGSDGEKRLLCDRHGELKVYLPVDPKEAT